MRTIMTTIHGWQIKHVLISLKEGDDEDQASYIKFATDNDVALPDMYKKWKTFLFRLLCYAYSKEPDGEVYNINNSNFAEFFETFILFYNEAQSNTQMKKNIQKLDKAADKYWEKYLKVQGQEELFPECVFSEEDGLISKYWEPIYNPESREEETTEEVEEEIAKEVEEETAEPETTDTKVDGIQQRGAKFTSMNFTFEPPTNSKYGMEKTDPKSRAFRNKLMRKLKNVTENEFFSADLDYIIYFTSKISAVEAEFHDPNNKVGVVILSIPLSWKDKLDVKESLILKKFASAWEEALDYADPTFDPEEHDEYDLWDELLYA